MNNLYEKFLNDIEELQPNYYGFEQVVYTAMDLLSERVDFNFDEICDWLINWLNNYSENEVTGRIIDQIEEIIKINPELEENFYSESFILGEDNFKYDLDKCCEYLGVLNPTDWVEWYRWFEDFIKEKNLYSGTVEAPTMSKAKSYELMAILSLYYVRGAINYNDTERQIKQYKQLSKRAYFNFGTQKEFLYMRKARATREVISSCISINIAKEWKDKIELKQIEKDISKKALSHNGKLGGLKRHEKNKKLKEEVISLWVKHKQEEENPSKNEFAKFMSKSMGIPESTIRKNWLQGV